MPPKFNSVAIGKPARGVNGSTRGKPNICPPLASASIQNWSPGCGSDDRHAQSFRELRRSACDRYACVSQICLIVTPSRSASASKRSIHRPIDDGAIMRFVAPEQAAVLLGRRDGNGFVVKHLTQRRQIRSGG